VTFFWTTFPNWVYFYLAEKLFQAKPTQQTLAGKAWDDKTKPSVTQSQQRCLYLENRQYRFQFLQWHIFPV